MLQSLMGVGISGFKIATVSGRGSAFTSVAVPSLRSVFAHALRGFMDAFAKFQSSELSPAVSSASAVLTSKPVAASLLFGRSMSARTGVDVDWVLEKSGESHALCLSHSVSYWVFFCKFSEGESFKVLHQGLDGVLKQALSFDGVKLESANPVLLNQFRAVLISQLPAHIVSDRKVSHAELLKKFTAEINQFLSLKSLEPETAPEDLSM